METNKPTVTRKVTTSSFRRVLAGIALGGLLLCFPSLLVCAEPLPALVRIPDGISAQQKAKLSQQKRTIETELRNFQSAAGVFNAKPAKQQTDEEYNTLQSQRSHYVQAAESFNALVDASIVDARNVPSGLPLSVEQQIPHTPSGDRVRKGFQAIQSHDWKVARAWFQEALNHDPGNAGIKRLVDLAQFTLQRQAAPSTKASVRISDDEMRKHLANADRYLDDMMEQSLRAALDDFNQTHPLPDSKPVKPPSMLAKPSAAKATSTEPGANWQAFFDALFKKPVMKSNFGVGAVRD